MLSASLPLRVPCGSPLAYAVRRAIVEHRASKLRVLRVPEPVWRLSGLYRAEIKRSAKVVQKTCKAVRLCCFSYHSQTLLWQYFYGGDFSAWMVRVVSGGVASRTVIPPCMMV